MQKIEAFGNWSSKSNKFHEEINSPILGIPADIQLQNHLFQF